MRKLILTLGILPVALSVFAQESKRNYNKSIFYAVQHTNTINTAAAEENRNKAKEVFPGWAVYTDKYSGEVLDVYGKPISATGNTIADKATSFMADRLNRIGINPAEWQIVKEKQGVKADHVNYTRNIAGHSVMFSKLGFRFAKDGKLARVQIHTYGTPIAQLPSISRDAIVTGDYETADIPEIHINSKEVKDWVWFPVPAENTYSLHPAWEVIVNAGVEGEVPLKLRCYVDGLDGKLLYRTNDVKEAFNVTVKGNVYTTSIFNPPTAEPLENLFVYGPTFTQYITNNSGFVSDGFQSLPASTTFRLEGKWSIVEDDPTSQIPTFTQNIFSLGTTYNMPVPARHASAYYHVNKVHEFMKSYFPSFTHLDFQLPTKVDLTSGTCNAFYNGTSINFYAAGGGCNSLAETPDVIYHEYGHGISDQYYNFMGMGTIQNGALNEACSDVWGISITGIPINGNGAFTNVTGGGFFRRYDGAPHILPRDLIEEVHGDGEIIAGTWWDVGVNLGSIPDMTQLFTLTYDDTPDGPDGTEGQVYHDVLISALLNDDIDNDISNGTPHFPQIIQAFAKHGIYLLGEVYSTHKEIAHQPAYAEIAVSTNLAIQDATFLQSAKLHYRNRSIGSWKAVPLTHTTGSTYTAKIPKQEAGTIVDYYFQLYTLQAQVNGTFPLLYDSTAANAHTVTIPYQFAVNVVAKDSNKFESTTAGWTIGNAPGDDATTGIWAQAKPIASYPVSTHTDIYISQMGADHTTGTGKCLVTGNASDEFSPIGDNDVDNGATTVITPSFDLSAYTNPMIEYYRWYADSKGGNPHNDFWVVKVGNSSTGNWMVVDSTYASDYNWRRRIFAVKSYLSALNDVQLKFVATDSVVSTLRNDGQSVVEAGIDDFFIYDRGPVGVSDPEIIKAVIAPNPANEVVNITIAGKYKGIATLYDVGGRVVNTMSLDGNNARYTLSTRQLASGQYMLILQSGSSIQSQKIVVQHQ